MSAANKALCAQYYNNGAGSWTISMLAAACVKGKITPTEFEEITGHTYGDYIPTGETLEDYKAAKIANSKTQLAAYLETHPLTYTDGKQYSVTAEKQSLLTSALARHQIAVAAGVQTELKWNATGEECTVWEYAALAALALAIAAYVEPLVAKQQLIEIAINACSTINQVKAIVINYGKPVSESVDLSDGMNAEEYITLLTKGVPIETDSNGNPVIVKDSADTTSN